MAANFNHLLNKKMDEVERPALLPVGTYEGVIKGSEFGEARNEDKSPICTFQIQITGTTEDIDPEDLVDSKGKPIDPAGRRFRRDFFLTEDSLWKLKEFLESCGISTDGRSFGEAIPEAKNAPVLVTLNTAESKGGDTFNNIQRLTGTANVD